MMEQPTDAELEAYEALAAKATPGPWYRTGPFSPEESSRPGGIDPGIEAVLIEGDDDGQPETYNVLDGSMLVDDYDFIAASRTIGPAASQALRAARGDIMSLRRHAWLHHGCPMAALYGDDGEMQCPHGDWVHGDVGDLLGRVRDENLARAAADPAVRAALERVG